MEIYHAFVVFLPAFSKFRKNTYNFLGRKNIIRTHTIFQEILSKISLEQHKDFPGDKYIKYHKNRSIFAGEISQNFARTDTHTPRTDILQNCLVGCLALQKHKVKQIGNYSGLKSLKSFLVFYNKSATAKL